MELDRKLALSVAFAVWMRERADKLGMTQEQVGNRLGLSKSSMTSYWRHATPRGGTPLSLDQIETLAAAFGTSVEEALTCAIAIQAKGETYREPIRTNPRQTRLRTRLTQRPTD